MLPGASAPQSGNSSGDHDQAIADRELGVRDLAVRSRQSHALDRAEDLDVEADRRLRPVDAQIRGDARIVLRDR